MLLPASNRPSVANPEHDRIRALERREAHWRRWGPYLSARQWGTVREDYSPDGRAWDYFPFDMSHVRAYRWGEDGILGISDNHQRLCFAPTFWNERDRILKERFFGLNGNEGNHGEDVKEVWYYLDNVPSHAYMKALYKYPQSAFPYDELRSVNARSGRERPEFELFDTGVFDNGAYFDIVVEYAKNDVEDLFIRLSITNRGPARAPLHVLPTFWFRNEWSWRGGSAKPTIAQPDEARQVMFAEHATLGQRWMASDGRADELLFTENETNYERAFGVRSPRPFSKDSFHRYLIEKDAEAVNARKTGTKAAFHYRFEVDPGATETIRLRLVDHAHPELTDDQIDAICARRAEEADAFYHDVLPAATDEENRTIQRRSFAGLLWGKQWYNFVVRDWLKGDPLFPAPPASRLHGRNSSWTNLFNEDVISMPDTWEYPWYAAWDLAFHVVPFALIDSEFAKRQLVTLTRERYMHPNGQLPAYEWAFDDVNPPVHAWAAYRVYKIEAKRRGGVGDVKFLERVFQKLLLNFTWWVNRKDVAGRNVFQGGFLGLDNIGVFDRSAKLPTGGYLAQADGTSWMGVYSLNMLAIAIELARHDSVYEHLANKFFEHFLYIADAINAQRDDDAGLWDPQDEFYYDQLYLPDGERIPLKVRSGVGVIPIYAVETLDPDTLDRLPLLKERVDWFVANRPELAEQVARVDVGGMRERRLLAIVNPDRLRKILRRVFDEEEFLSPYGMRALSRYHRLHPYELTVEGTTFRVDYEPAESTSGLFGGNSNWRGPIWFPLNYLLIESLQKFHYYLGDGYKVEFPTGSGNMLTLWEISMQLSHRLIALFRRDQSGRRPFQRAHSLMHTDPRFTNHLLFHEYFNGDTGQGLGASHQTGWTGVVAKLIQQTSEYEAPIHPPVGRDFSVRVAR
jgi:hypothetical protein